jgi:hypothetical protein
LGSAWTAGRPYPAPRPGSPGGGMRWIRKRGNLMAQFASNPEPEAAGKLERSRSPSNTKIVIKLFMRDLMPTWREVASSAADGR